MNKEQLKLIDEKLAEIKFTLEDRVVVNVPKDLELLYHILACTIWQIVAIAQNP